MTNRITFIHSGDIHLGAPFRGLRDLSPKWADRLTRAIPEAYDRVVDAAIERGVDFVLFAGDEFDTDKASYAHHRHFLQGLERLRDAQIPVYLIAGNHDPYATWAGLRDQLPENVHMFGSDGPGYVVYERDGEPVAIIAARGFSNQAPESDIAEGMTRAAAEAACGVQVPFVVGMLHTGLWMDPYKAPTSEDVLYASGMDYWALGHIHKNFRFPKNAAETKIAFCGCAQGRDIKEAGDRGCYAVTLEEGVPNQLEFIACESVEWEQLRVDVSACAGAEDVLGACVRAMFDANSQVICEEMIARVTLVGATPLHGMRLRPRGISTKCATSSMNAIRRFSVTRLSTRRLPPSIGMRCAPRAFSRLHFCANRRSLPPTSRKPSNTCSANLLRAVSHCRRISTGRLKARARAPKIWPSSF